MASEIACQSSALCMAFIEIENGEYVSPCHRPKGHDGEHEGYCLGSRAVWTDDLPTPPAREGEPHAKEIR